MKLSMEEIQLLARRSRLALTEQELEKYSRDLGALEELSEALLPYTNGLSEEKEPQTLCRMRADECKEGLPREDWLMRAPARKGEYVPVPCVVEEVEYE